MKARMHLLASFFGCLVLPVVAFADIPPPPGPCDALEEGAACTENNRSGACRRSICSYTYYSVDPDGRRVPATGSRPCKICDPAATPVVRRTSRCTVGRTPGGETSGMLLECSFFAAITMLASRRRKRFSLRG